MTWLSGPCVMPSRPIDDRAQAALDLAAASYWAGWFAREGNKELAAKHNHFALRAAGKLLGHPQVSHRQAAYPS